MNRFKTSPITLALLVAVAAHSTSIATAHDAVTQDAVAAATKPDPSKPVATPQSDDDLSRGERLAGYLTGAKFVGKFTVDGQGDQNAKTEEYVIHKCQQIDGDDQFRLTARIKYGDTNGDFPIELTIPFSGRTPVITLDAIWIPGLGTFSARVLIHDGRYAGTWQHGEHGGHMFGKIVKTKDDVDSDQ